MTRRLKLLKGNKGITLIELMLAFAILAVLAVMAALIVRTGGRTYSGISADINLQYESQVAMSQLQEYVLDCNGEVGVIKDALDLMDELYIYNRNDDDSYAAYKITAAQASGDLLMYTGANAPGDVDFSGAASQPMSSYVQSFVADISAGGKSVVITISYQLGGREYSGTQTITFRNAVDTFTIS